MKKPMPHKQLLDSASQAELEEVSAGEMLAALRALNSEARRPGPWTDKVLGDSDVLVSQWEKECASDADIDAFTLTVRLRRLAIMMDERAGRRIEALGIKYNEMMLLLALRRVGAPYTLRPTDIVRMHGVSSGTATYRIDQVINQSLAERIPDPGDKRGYLIKLTRRGKLIVDNFVATSANNASTNLRPLLDIPGAGELFVEMLRFVERRIEQDLIP